MQVSGHDQDSYSSQRKNDEQQQHHNNDPEDESMSKFSPKVQIIAASGDNIIAVANPALAMSAAIIAPLVEKRESRSLDKE